MSEKRERTYRFIGESVQVDASELKDREAKDAEKTSKLPIFINRLRTDGNELEPQ